MLSGALEPGTARSGPPALPRATPEGGSLAAALARCEHEVRAVAQLLALGVRGDLSGAGGSAALPMACEVSRLESVAGMLNALAAAASGSASATAPSRHRKVGSRSRRGAAVGGPLALLLSALAARSELIAERRVEVSWDGAPAALVANDPRLAQALGALLDNAVAHGQRSVCVRVRCESAQSGRRSLAIEIANERRSQPLAPSEGQCAHRGSGLGLAIAGEALRALGGRLSVASGPDSFRAVVEVPLEAARPKARSGLAGPPEARCGLSKRPSESSLVGA